MTAYVIATEDAISLLKITDVVRATFDICESKGRDICIDTSKGVCQVFLSKMYADESFNSVKSLRNHFSDSQLKKNMYQFDFEIKVDSNMIEECE